LAQAADGSEENFLGLAEGKFNEAEATIGDMTTGAQMCGYKVEAGIRGVLLPVWAVGTAKMKTRTVNSN
jgi:hypothetical protein